jgi:opacity protein-like surface antigen
MKKLITVFLIILSSIATYAQSGDVGLFAGSSYYTGDLNPGVPFKKSLPAFGALYRYNFTDRLALKMGYTATTLKADDYQNRGLSFNTKLNELSAQFEVNFTEFGFNINENKLSPYIFGGIGYTWVKVNGYSYGTELSSFTTNLTSFPFGLGIKYNPIENVNLGLEWGLRKTAGKDADKIDNVYEPGTRVSSANDWYAFAGLWISVKLNFFKSERCEELTMH